MEMGESPKIQDLRLKNHHLLEKWPHLMASLSHSKDAGAAVVSSRKDICALGIDIERTERTVKEGIFRRITNSSDIHFKNLEARCLKEAIYKCLMNTGRFDTSFEFSEIILSDQKWSHSQSGQTGQWQL